MDSIGNIIGNIFRNTFRLIFLIANVVIGTGFLVCAYSPSISPVEHPVLACAGLFIPIFILLNSGFLVFWLIVSRKYAILPLLFFILGWNSLMSYCPVNIFKNDYKGGDKIKLLTYNTMHAQGNIPDYIINSEADIVCLQEYPFTDKKLKSRLQKTYPYIRTYEFGAGNAVACLSKFPIKSVNGIDMKSSNNGSALFKIKYNRNTLIPIIINHLESNKLDNYDKEVYKDMLKSPDEVKVKSGSKHLLRKLADAVVIRGPQADAVSARIKDLNSSNILVCGDFNDTPVSYTHEKIADGLQDAFIEAGNGPGITYNRNLLYFRIDHILAGKAYRILDCKVDRSIDDSDHYPMWVVLEIIKDKTSDKSDKDV